ncbi:MAG TPA: saccharopine dehydrogenase NADP-binding domain-containing protein [Chitinophagaceae bacterium]|nr:saccharopine dehydrogenase NADP-binding domain-containing protein [Chitinophagaceae bacterium]
MMQSTSFLLYGANGYTGELIARFAQQYQLQPILAGRRKEVIAPMADKLHLPFRIIDLNDRDTLQAALKEVRVVIHAAGPFHQTAKQMIEACLQTGTHYLDINGDISVFEMIKKYDTAAKKAGIMLLPGAGFDVVPTDCIALQLKKLLPDAVSLQLAFATLGGGISHGTAMTMANRLGEAGAVRKRGKIIRTPIGQNGMWVDFGKKKLFVMSIPWGDISTAYVTTGIPDIETFTGIAPKTFYILKGQPIFNWILRTNFVRKFIKKKISQRPAGPSDEQREKAISLVWGKVINEDGKAAIVRLSGPEGYTLTAHSSLIIAQKILNENFFPGYHTPAGAYGEILVLEIPGVEREIVRL